MPDYKQILYDMEVHSVKGIQKYFLEGGDPNEVHSEVPLFTSMVEMYTRGSNFKNCVKAFIDAGLAFEEEALLAVLSHDPEKLREIINREPSIVSKRYFLFKNTYTPLTGGTLMHYCAEYNSVDCAKLLFQQNADINAKAAMDEYGFGGHTPVFHTVNQNGNSSKEMLYFLLQESADLLISVKGLIWGKEYEWETFIPSVNPISYAMMGSLPQMHRNEKVISEVVSLLMKHAYGIDYTPKNVPNAYLK
jgi:ankyrin repeat protein